MSRLEKVLKTRGAYAKQHHGPATFCRSQLFKGRPLAQIFPQFSVSHRYSTIVRGFLYAIDVGEKLTCLDSVH